MPRGNLKITTFSRRELLDITREVEHVVKNAAVTSGMLLLFNPHTTAGLTINEGADPDVRRDILKGLCHIVPEELDYRHSEGNSQAHILTLLTGSSLTVFIDNNKLVLGTWQKIFFCEYDGPRSRTVHWKIVADVV
jgi:secondary thiamine-phosphate synthase enzyme